MKKKVDNKKNGANLNTAKPETAARGSLTIKYVIGIISFICIIGLTYKEKPRAKVDLSVGEIAPQDIRAEVDFSYADKVAAELLQQEAVKNVPDIYYIDGKTQFDADNEVNNLFNEIGASEDPEKIKEKFSWVDDLTLKVITKSSDIEKVRQNILKICNEFLNKGVITNSIKIRIISKGKDSICILDKAEQRLNEVNIDKFSVYDDLDPAIDLRLKSIHPFDRQLRQAMKAILLKVIKPNVVFDLDELEQRKELAQKNIPPVYKNVKRGQVILRGGDPATDIKRLMILAHEEELVKLRPKFSYWGSTIGNILLVGILFIILGTYLHYHQPEIFSCNKRLLLLSIIVLSTLFIARAMIYLPVNADKPFWEYFIVVPMGAILIAVLIDKELAILSSVIMSVLTTVFAGRSLPYTVILLFGSIISIQSTIGILQRWKFITAGVFVGFANVLAIIMVNLLNLYSPELLSWKVIGYQSLGGFVSGLACAMVADIYMPILEKLFNITTDIRLLELSDLNHPLLKMMITEAPGTYHHSIMVGNMADDAASAIGANPLLAKVGGYFHDVGKTTKPEYFIENTWFESESRHEKLMPTLSNLVITAHVKDGVQLAQKYRLPKLVLDIIKEHHGTSLVYFFYKKAEKGSAQEGSEVSETDFRYPGPKPSNKESAIILLADAIEAASHILVKPTPSKIEELVREISLEKIQDGQLDECGLTLKDIDIIKDRFSRILTGILHKRIEYPERTKDSSSKGNSLK